MDVRLKILFNDKAGHGHVVDTMTKATISFDDPRLVRLVKLGDVTLEQNGTVNLGIRERVTHDQLHVIAELQYGYAPRNLEDSNGGDPELIEELKRSDEQHGTLEQALEKAGLTQKQFDDLCKRADVLELSVRSQNCLHKAGIEYIWQLVERSGEEMLKLKNFQNRSLNEVNEILADLHLTLEMKDKIDAHMQTIRN